MNVSLAPLGIPVFHGIPAGIAQNVTTRPHTLLELQRKTQQTFERDAQSRKSSMGEADVDSRKQKENGIPAFAGGDDFEQRHEHRPSRVRGAEFEQKISRVRFVFVFLFVSLFFG